ncbi:MAG: flippase [Candidatus Kerfeldbacteria bacterium]|nr:flippase [Candidatus Kerfeldbacteria bacterium]
MSLTRNIASNTVQQVIGKALSTAIGIWVLSAVTTYLGTGGYGQYIIIISFLSFFSILADLGLYVILTKKISEPGADEQRVTANIFTMRLVTAVVLLGLAPLVVMLFPYAPIVKTGIAITTFSFLFITLTQVLYGVFQKHLAVYKIAFAENAGRVVLLIGTLLVIHFNGGLLWIMAVVVFGSFCNLLLTTIWVQRYVRLQLRWEWDVWKDVLHASWPIALSIVFNLVYFRADALILAYYWPDSDVGIYGQPYKILEVLASIPAIFAGLALPVLTNAFARNDRSRFFRVLQKSVDALLMMAVPLVIGTYFVATDVVVWISKPAFAPSGPVLRILILATAMIFLGNLFANTVVAINKQKTIILGYAAVAVIAIVGYFYFIPRYSYFGAAWMTVATEGLMMLISMILVYRTTRAPFSFSVPLRIVLSAAVMGFAMWLVSDIHFLLRILMGVVVYGIMILSTGALNKQTLQDLRSSGGIST